MSINQVKWLDPAICIAPGAYVSAYRVEQESRPNVSIITYAVAYSSAGIMKKTDRDFFDFYLLYNRFCKGLSSRYFQLVQSMAIKTPEVPLIIYAQLITMAK